MIFSLVTPLASGSIISFSISEQFDLFLNVSSIPEPCTSFSIPELCVSFAISEPCFIPEPSVSFATPEP